MMGGMFDEEEDYDYDDSSFEPAAYSGRQLPPRPADPRNDTDLCGLDNQGATCYMNSLLQVLHMTPELRRGLYDLSPAELGMPDPDNGELPTIEPREIAIALQRLFSRLQSDDVESTDTEELTSAFGWSGSETSEQQDLQELKNVLMDVLKESLAGTSAGALLPELFEGVYRNLIVCVADDLLDGFRKELADEAFLDVFAQVRGQASLEQSLRTKVTFEEMSGANQYNCEELGRKVDAQKGVTFKVLPPVLSFTLLRFEMDWSADPPQRNKITDKMSFPLEIDMQPYTEALRADGSKLATAAAAAAASQAERWYDLYGVVVHSGGAYGGHYYAYVRDVTGQGQWSTAGRAEPPPAVSEEQTAASDIADMMGLSSASMLIAEPAREAESDDGPEQEKAGPRDWFCFNDSRVSPAKLSDLESKTGGSDCAYMLLYRQRLPFKKTGRGKNGSVKPALPSHLESERAARMQGLQLKREQYTASVNQLSLEVTSPAAWMLNPDGLLMRRPGDQTPAAEPPPVPVVENPDTEQIVGHLVEMGFGENGSRRAVVACRHTADTEECMEWVVLHMEDDDFNDPLLDPLADGMAASELEAARQATADDIPDPQARGLNNPLPVTIDEFDQREPVQTLWKEVIDMHYPKSDGLQIESLGLTLSVVKESGGFAHLVKHIPLPGTVDESGSAAAGTVQDLGLSDADKLMLWNGVSVGPEGQTQPYSGSPSARPVRFYVTYLFMTHEESNESGDRGDNDDNDDETDDDHGGAVLQATSSDMLAPLPVEKHELSVILPAYTTVDVLAAAVADRTGLPAHEQLLLDTASGAFRANISQHAQGNDLSFGDVGLGADDTYYLTVEKLPPGWEEDNQAHGENGTILTLSQRQRAEKDNKVKIMCSEGAALGAVSFDKASVTSLLVPRDTTAGSLKQMILQRLRPDAMPEASARLRRIQYGGSEGPLISVEDEVLGLDDAMIYSGTSLVLEDQPALTAASGEIVIRYTTGSTGNAQQWRLQTNSSDTIAELKASLCADVNMRAAATAEEASRPTESCAWCGGLQAETPWVVENARLRQAEGVSEDPAKLLDEGSSLKSLTVLDNALVFLERGLPPARGALSFELYGVLPVAAANGGSGGGVALLQAECQESEEMTLHELKSKILRAEDMMAVLAGGCGGCTADNIRLRGISGDGTKIHPYVPDRILKGDSRQLKDKTLGVSGKRICAQYVERPEALAAADRVYILRWLSIGPPPNAGTEPSAAAVCSLGPPIELIVSAPATGTMMVGHLADAVNAASGVPQENLELAKQTGKGNRLRWAELVPGPKAKAKFNDFTIIGVKDTSQDPNGEYLFADADGGAEEPVSTVKDKPLKKSKRSTSPDGVRIKRYGEASAAAAAVLPPS